MPMEKIIKVDDSIGLTIEALSKKKYHIWKTVNEEKKIILITVNDKAITQFKMRDDEGKRIYNLIEDSYSDLNKKAIGDKFSVICTNLERLRVETLTRFNPDDDGKLDDKIEENLANEIAKMEEKYPLKFKHFERRCQVNDFTPLQFISHVTQGLGVGLTIEVLKAFFGYFQTYIGFKGTNVIAVGSQTSGKSHILETALSLIPEERVHKGITSPGYFFRKYNHQDLTGHIFYLGDLGGENDNQNTIEMRDILKQLSTDGYINRGIVDDEDPTDQWVMGYPCLSYTTAHEDMINSQERSRSMIITPPDVDPYRLMTYKSVMRSPGDYHKTIEQIHADQESVKGLVYYTKEHKSEFDSFDPYMYNIVDFLGDMEDFNRKIDEFDGILTLCCELNKCKVIKRTVINEDYDKVEKPLLIASKQDVLNAFSIFDTTNGLLPTESALINGLIRNFKPYKLEEPPVNMDKDYESKVKENLGVNIDTKEINWRAESQNSFFTESSIRKEFSNQRWYRKNKDEMAIKLRKLYMNNYLIQIGSENKEPVYGLNYNMTEKLDNLRPNFGGNSFKKAKNLFVKNFSDCGDEFMEYVDRDVQLNVKNIDFEINDSMLYELPW